MTLTLAGSEHTLLFGVMGYFAHIQNATGKDAFEFLNSLDERRKDDAPTNERLKLITEDAPVFVYAGINSYLDSVDEKNVDKEQVFKWCRSLTAAQLGEVMAMAINAMSTDEVGEKTGQTKEQAAA